MTGKCGWTLLALLAAGSCALPEYTKDYSSLASVGGSAAGATTKATQNTLTKAGSSGYAGSLGGAQAGGSQIPTSQGGGETTWGGAESGGSTSGVAGSETSGGMRSTQTASTLGGASSLAGANSLGGMSQGGALETVPAAGNGGATASGGAATGGWTNVSCPDGYAACSSPSCDTQISHDTLNCGKCGNVCSGKNVAHWTCNDACIVADDVNDCASGFRNCNGLDNDGCELDLTDTHSNYCGACGVTCKNQICGNNHCDTICGKRALDATATCFQATLVGSDTDLGDREGRARKWLIGVHRPLPEYPDQVLVAMGVVEKSGAGTTGSVKYKLGMYDSDINGDPRNLIWVSPLQTAAGTLGTPRTNVVQVDPPAPLTAGALYWQMILVYDPGTPDNNASLELATAGEDSKGKERQLGFGHGSTTNPTDVGITTMPASLSGQPYQTLSEGALALKSPAIFAYVAHP